MPSSKLLNAAILKFMSTSALALSVIIYYLFGDHKQMPSICPFLLARRRGCDELAPFVLAARAAAAPPPTPAWGSARTRRPVLAASDVGIGVLTGGSVPRAAGRRGERGCGSSRQVSGGGVRSARRGRLCAEWRAWAPRIAEGLLLRHTAPRLV